MTMQEIFWGVFAALGLTGLVIEMVRGRQQAVRFERLMSRIDIMHQDFRFFANRIDDHLKKPAADFKQFEWFKDMFRELTVLKLSALAPHSVSGILREKRLGDQAQEKLQETMQEAPHTVGGNWQPPGTDGSMKLEG